MLVNEKANYHVKKESYHFLTQRTNSVPRDIIPQNAQQLKSDDLDIVCA